MAKIDAFFNLMFEQSASDLHLSSGNPPILRIRGELQRVDFPPLENDALKAMLYEITPEYKIKVFEETGDVDFGYEIPNISRFRANFFNKKNGHDHIITVEDPIEFVHESKNCLVNHREVGIHTKSFAAALRGALREDPDVILV